MGKPHKEGNFPQPFQQVCADLDFIPRNSPLPQRTCLLGKEGTIGTFLTLILLTASAISEGRIGRERAGKGRCCLRSPQALQKNIYLKIILRNAPNRIKKIR